MIDYFELYKLVLTAAYERSPKDAHELFDFLSDSDLIKNSLKSGVDNKFLSSATIEVVDNLIEDGLLKATVKQVKEGTLYYFNGISTTGYQYLKSLEEPEFKDKLKETLRSEGIPLTATNITKFIAKLLI